MADDAPVVDDDHCVEPASTLVEEEGHVVFVLTVEVFLIGEVGVSEAFDEEGVVVEGNTEDDFIFGLVADGEHRFVFHQQARYGELGEGCTED